MINFKKIRRKFGFNSDSNGIIKRYMNEQKNWESHIKNTKDFIVRNAQDKKKNLCVVLGSGWCLDIPLEFLSQNFEKVILSDLIHPPQIIHKYSKLKNIEFITYDISQVLNPILQFRKNKKNNKDDLISFIQNSVKEPFLKNYKPDYVISANVLSQIAWFPSEFIRKNKLCNETELKKVKKYIEEIHLRLLPENKSVLISDYFQYEYNSKSEIINEENRINISLRNKQKIKEWVWDFDLSGNFETGNPVKFKVVALRV